MPRNGTLSSPFCDTFPDSAVIWRRNTVATAITWRVQWLADRLQGSKRGLDDYFRGVLDAGQIDAMAQLDRIRTRLDAVIAKIRGDVRGYSGFFDYVRIDEGVLDKVYDHDMSLIADVDQFANTIEALGVQPGSLQDVSSDLLASPGRRRPKLREARRAVAGDDDQVNSWTVRVTVDDIGIAAQ